MRAIYYDTETTGLKSETDRIIEIAAFDPENDKSFSSLVNPQIPIPEETTSIHNITDDMVKEEPSFEVVGKKFAEFCSGDVILVAHNNDSFDKLFLEAEFKRNNIELPSWKYLDTLKWARKYRNDLPKHSLQYLREVYEIPANQAHRALDDVIILYEVFSRMIDDLPISKVYQLLHQSKAAPPQFMPFGKYQGQPLQNVPKGYVSWLLKNGVFDKSENQELKNSFEKLGILEGMSV